MKLLAGVGLALHLVLGIALTPGVAYAQDTWPDRPITFVVPYAPGGYTDLVARLTARYRRKGAGQVRRRRQPPRSRRHRRDAGRRERRA